MATKVVPGWRVVADVQWRNAGQSKFAPEFRLDLKRSGLSTWTEGPVVKSPQAAPGETVVAQPAMLVPANWGSGTRISVQIVLIGREGAMWGPSGWWRNGVGVEILEVETPNAGWVEVISVEPYAETPGPA